MVKSKPAQALENRRQAGDNGRMPFSPEDRMADVVDCPKTQDWQRLESGACSAEETALLRRHLKQCPRCASQFSSAIARGQDSTQLSAPGKDPAAELTARISPEDAVSDQTLALLLQGQAEADDEPSSEVLEQSTL